MTSTLERTPCPLRHRHFQQTELSKAEPRSQGYKAEPATDAAGTDFSNVTKLRMSSVSSLVSH